MVLHGHEKPKGLRSKSRVTWVTEPEEEDGEFEASLGYPVALSQEKNQKQRCGPRGRSTESSFLHTAGSGRAHLTQGLFSWLFLCLISMLFSSLADINKNHFKHLYFR